MAERTVGPLVFHLVVMMADLLVADLVVQWVATSAASMVARMERLMVAVTAGCWAGKTAGLRAE